MCLGIPGKVIEIWEEAGTRMSTVEFGGTTKTVCLAYLPDMQVGEYTIVHAGFRDHPPRRGVGQRNVADVRRPRRARRRVSG